MTWIKTGETSFTAQSSVSTDNCFSATYTHYVVYYRYSGSAAGFGLGMRLRTGGADASGSNYRRQVVDASNTTITGARATGATSWPAILGIQHSDSLTSGYTRISNPFEAVPTTAWADFGYSMTGNIVLRRDVYAHDLTTSYSGFTAIAESGNVTGTITVYGLKES